MPKIIAFTGNKQVGKDTAAKVLVEQFGFRKFAFADPLKNMLREYLRLRGCSEDYIERCIEGDLKETPIPSFSGHSPRYAMQTLGTEWGRNCIGKSFWIDTWRSVTAGSLSPIVATDLRFRNEAAAVRELGGTIIRINRPDTEFTDGHSSETEVYLIDADHFWTNDFQTKETFQDYVTTKVKGLLA